MWEATPILIPMHWIAPSEKETDNAVDDAKCEVRSRKCELLPVRHSKSDICHCPRLGIQRSHSALNEMGRSGFVMANTTRSAHSYSMKITEDVRKYAAEQGLDEQEALKKGMEEKSKEFVEKGAEVYAKA